MDTRLKLDVYNIRKKTIININFKIFYIIHYEQFEELWDETGESIIVPHSLCN